MSSTSRKSKQNSVGHQFAWTEKGRDATKRTRSGEIRARDKAHAKALLRKNGIQATTIDRIQPPSQGAIPVVQVAKFSRQIATMLEARVPLADALGLVASNMNTRKDARMQPIIRTLRSEVESGVQLSAAMRKFPKCFDKLYCDTLAAGENAGDMEEVFKRLATYQEKALRTRQRIRKAMTYPIVVLVIALGVTIAMLQFVLPNFENMYAQLKGELPFLTQLLLDTSDLIEEHGLLLTGGIIGGLFLFIRTYKYNKRFRSAADQAFLKIPAIGAVLEIACYARWSRTFSTLARSGVPLIETLESVGSVAGLRKFEHATNTLRIDVGTGIKVSDSMEHTRAFPPEMSQLIRIGEESGRMEEMLDRLASMYETKLDDIVDNISDIIQPMFMLVIGVLVGTLILGIYLPIFSMGDMV